MSTLEEACAEARLKVIADHPYKAKADLSSDKAANEHDAKMRELFQLMEAAEEQVRANWKPAQGPAAPQPKKKDTA